MNREATATNESIEANEANESKSSVWRAKHYEGLDYESIHGRECEITLEPRPYYCDRGNYLAKLFPTGALFLSIDEADGWPRYYFHPEHAKSEINAWLKKRGQWID